MYLTRNGRTNNFPFNCRCMYAYIYILNIFSPHHLVWYRRFCCVALLEISSHFFCYVMSAFFIVQRKCLALIAQKTCYPRSFYLWMYIIHSKIWKMGFITRDINEWIVTTVYDNKEVHLTCATIWLTCVNILVVIVLRLLFII